MSHEPERTELRAAIVGATQEINDFLKKVEKALDHFLQEAYEQERKMAKDYMKTSLISLQSTVMKNQHPLDFSHVSKENIEEAAKRVTDVIKDKVEWNNLTSEQRQKHIDAIVKDEIGNNIRLGPK